MQVNDFLSGKAPLNLTMRLGDHMMLIQLQLSTVTPSSSRRSASSAPHSSTPSLQIHAPTSSSNSKANTSATSPSPSSCKNPATVPVTSESSSTPSATPTISSSSSLSGLKISSTPSLITRPLMSLYSKSSATNVEAPQSSSHPPSSESSVHITQSPLKSLENATNNLSVFTGSKSPEKRHSCPASSSSSSCKCDTAAAKPTLDTRALAEASRNLTQTLKQLSSEVLTSRSDPAEVSDKY